MAPYISPSDSSLAFPSPVILPRVMLSWAVAGKKKVLEMLSPRRCTPGLQRFKISLGTCEHGPGFQSTTWWGMAYSDWTMGSSWWKKMPRYLPQDKSKVFSGICKEEDDKKEHNENYYWNWFSFFGNDLLNNLCTSPRLPSQPCCRIKRHLKECCGSFAASGQDVAHFVIFLSEKKKNLFGDYS